MSTRRLWWFALLLPGCGTTDRAPAREYPAIVVNELMARNRFSLSDGAAARADWLELYNPTTIEVSLAGWSVTDDPAQPSRLVLGADAVVPAGGHLLLFPGATTSDATPTGFHLGIEGGELLLVAPDGTVVDQLAYGPQATDLSAARIPDGSPRWEIMWEVTPGTANPQVNALPIASSDVASVVPAAGDVSELLFPEDRIVEFALDLSGDAIASLRAEPRRYVQGALRILGRRLAPIGVRLKGQNSFRPIDEKPSFRLEIDHFVRGAELFGLDDLVLNNMSSDPTMMRERLAYRAMRQAGLAASRCSHAWVTVSGQDYGLYAHVERVEPRMLARWFPDASGPLFEATDVDTWEGQLSSYDLAEVGSDYEVIMIANQIGPVASYQHEDGPDDRSALSALARTLMLPGARSLPAAHTVDLEQFRRFWGMAAAIGHFDGFPFSFDDYFVYVDPTDGRIRFLPWGMDESLNMTNYWPLAGNALLPRRCNGVLSCQSRVLAAIWQAVSLLETTNLDGERRRIQEQVASFVARDQRRRYSDGEVAAAQAAQQQYIAGRRAFLLQQGIPPQL